MYATIPVYKYSLTDAVNYKERELWLESYNINMECKRAIEERATTAFNTRELDLLIKDLVEKFGVERALYVLSKSVQENDWTHGLPRLSVPVQEFMIFIKRTNSKQKKHRIML